MRMLFGTDGIRGVAGDPPLDHPTVYCIGAALGRYLGQRREHPDVVLGQDTRESSCWIAESLTGGLEWAGARVQSAGVITTPAVALLGRGGFSAGVVISASHNPWTDNGIKVFAHDGYKLSDAIEEKIESEIFDLLHNRVKGFDPGRIPEPRMQASVAHTHPELLQKYVDWLASNVRGTDFRGMRVLVDCANGAATPVAHRVFAACGIAATFLHDRPDGRNINEGCGALHPELVAAEVAKQPGQYAAGVTFDGDADRALFSDDRGKIVNGDAVLLVAAREMKKRGTLGGDTVVATTMSNMGLEVALRHEGIRMLRAPVGDKYVLEEMGKSGAVLGGEQSGHIIFRDGDATTGDGLLTALRVLQVVAASGRSLADLVGEMKVFPQTIKNIRVREKKPFEQVPEVAEAIRAAEKELDGNGRVVVRYSGTEALARVMVEADSEATMRRLTDAIAGAIQKTLGV